MVDHGEHDIHGQVFEMWPDGRVMVDEDCDCPPDCEQCQAEGVIR